MGTALLLRGLLYFVPLTKPYLSTKIQWLPTPDSWNESLECWSDSKVAIIKLEKCKNNFFINFDLIASKKLLFCSQSLFSSLRVSPCPVRNSSGRTKSCFSNFLQTKQRKVSYFGKIEIRNWRSACEVLLLPRALNFYCTTSSYWSSVYGSSLLTWICVVNRERLFGTSYTFRKENT